MNVGKLIYDGHEYERFVRKESVRLYFSYIMDSQYGSIKKAEGNIDLGGENWWAIYIEKPPAQLFAKLCVVENDLVISLSEIHGSGHGSGTLLLTALLQCATLIEKYTKRRCAYLRGRLTWQDKVRGNWKRSLPFYRHFAEKHQISCYFSDCRVEFENIRNGTAKVYLDELMFSAENDEGRVWFIF